MTTLVLFPKVSKGAISTVPDTQEGLQNCYGDYYLQKRANVELPFICLGNIFLFLNRKLYSQAGTQDRERSKCPCWGQKSLAHRNWGKGNNNILILIITTKIIMAKRDSIHYVPGSVLSLYVSVYRVPQFP